MDEHRMEEWEEKCRREMAEWNAKNIWDMEMFKSVIIAGQAALKSAILINGGATVALLAFIGSVFKVSQNSEVVTKLSHAMFCFVIGVLSGAIASGVVYMAQFVYARKKLCLGHILNGFSWVLVVLSYILFLTGVILAFKVF